ATAEAAALAATTASDNCPGDLTKSVSTLGDCNANIIVTVNDRCGNHDSATYNTRIDNTSPVFSGLPDATLNVQCMADVPAAPTVTANDDTSAMHWTLSVASGSPLKTGLVLSMRVL